MDDIQSMIDVWSMRPKPGTPSGEAWEQGCRQGWAWAMERAASPVVSAGDLIGGPQTEATNRFSKSGG